MQKRNQVKRKFGNHTHIYSHPYELGSARLTQTKTWRKPLHTKTKGNDLFRDQD